MLSIRSIRPRLRQGGSRRQQGLSIVELLVGVALGLFVVGGAISLTVDSLVNNRQLLVTTRLTQDMRAAAEIVARDLRRASYWDSAISGLWSAGAPVVTAANPYTGITTSTGTIGYSYQRPDVDPASAPLGFRRVVDADGRGSIEISDPSTSNDWQVITDTTSLDVTAFTITPTVRTVELWSYCSCRTRVPVSTACEDPTLSVATTRPMMLLRQFEIRIQARSITDSAVQRELRETVRVRNDELRNPNGCPGA